LIVNTTIADNDPSSGQAILAHDPGVSCLTMLNTIMWNNALDIQWDGPTDNVSVDYSDIGSGWPGPTIISEDPRFVDPGGGDYHLSLGSPCIDSGTDAGAPDHDLDGTARPIDGDGDGTPTTDMGAYEAPEAAGGTRYVDGATGSDTGDCRDAMAPCQTIVYAIGQALSGDELHVAGGTYTENLDIDGKTLILRGGYTADSGGFTPGGGETIVDGGGVDRTLLIHGNDSVVENVTITGGQAPEEQCWGGAVWVTGGDVTIRGSTIRDNVSQCGGGGAVEVNSDYGPARLTLEGTTLSGNGGADNGGALHAWDASVLLRNSTVMSNTAGFGGGISFNGAGTHSNSLVIEESIIAHNQASAHGGGLDVYGARLVMTNTLLTGNAAEAIDVLSLNSSDASIVNSTVADNNPSAGQAILAHDPEVSRLTLLNAIMWNNALDIQWDGPTDNVSIEHSNIASGWPGEGNISEDPQFVDPGGGDYHLGPGSPCIDSGTDAGAPDHDLDGTPRPIDGDGDSTATTDMGAYEAPEAAGGTRYIDGETGSDAADCRDPLAPCQTIGYAISQAVSGDELHIAHGTYTENLVIDGKGLLLRGGYTASPGGFVPGRAETIIDGGGIDRTLAMYSGDSEIHHLTITGGQTPEGECWGGGVVLMHGDFTIRDCVITDNVAGCSGGGISTSLGVGQLTIKDTIITDNQSGIIGGGITAWHTGMARLTNVLLANNTAASSGSAVAVVDGQVSLSNVTIAGNEGGRAVSGVDEDPAPQTLTAQNSIIWGNAPGDLDCSVLDCDVSTSNIGGGFAGTGNIDADPQFKDPFEGDFRLLPGSPCVDTGTDADAPDHDLQNEVRPLDGDGDGVATTDMGAFELRLEQLYLPLILGGTGEEGSSRLVGHWTGTLEDFHPACQESAVSAADLDAPFTLVLNELRPVLEGAYSYVGAGYAAVGEGAPLAPAAAQAVPQGGGVYEVMAYASAASGGQVTIVELTGAMYVSAPDLEAHGASGTWHTAGCAGNWAAIHVDEAKEIGPPVNTIPGFYMDGEVSAVVDCDGALCRMSTDYGVNTNMVSRGAEAITPDDEVKPLEAYTDIFSPHVDFISEFRYSARTPVTPTLGQPYSLRLLDALGSPILGARATDLWTGCPNGPPRNHVATPLAGTATDITLSWDAVPPAPGWDPAAGVGWYQPEISVDERAYYGAGDVRTTSHVIPWASFDEQAPGRPDGEDFGQSLSELPEGEYRIQVGSLTADCHAADHGAELHFRKVGEAITFFDPEG
jgi:hypothetical protein